MTPGVNFNPLAAADDDLVRRARRRNRDAFHELYRRHAETAWRLAHVVTGGQARPAAAAVADGFTRAIRNGKPAGGAPVSFSNRLLAATRTSAMDAMGGTGAPPAPNTELFLGSAFWGLPERWRSILWVTRAERRPLADGAAVIGVSPQGAAGLAERAETALTKRLDGQFGDGADLASGLRAIAPALPVDLLDLVEAAWRDASGLKTRAAAAAASPATGMNPGLRRRVALGTAGLLGIGLCAATILSHHGSQRGDLPVASGTSPAARHVKRPGTAASRQVALGSNGTGGGGLSGLVAGTDLSFQGGGSAPDDAPTGSSAPRALPFSSTPGSAGPGIDFGANPASTGNGPGPSTPPTTAPSSPLPTLPPVTPTTLLTVPTLPGSTGPTLPPATVPPVPPPTVPSATIPPAPVPVTTTTTVPITSTVTTVVSTATTLTGAVTSTTIASRVTTVTTTVAPPRLI